MKQMTKRLLALLAASALVLGLGACGEKAEEEAEGALSEEEYIDAVDNLSLEMFSVQQASQEAEIADEQAARDLVEELQKPLRDFIAIVPPAAYAEAHEKLQSGCQAMIDYIDIIFDAAGQTDDDVLQQAAEDANEKLMTAMEDLSEGSTLLGDAVQ